MFARKSEFDTFGKYLNTFGAAEARMCREPTKFGVGLMEVQRNTLRTVNGEAQKKPPSIYINKTLLSSDFDYGWGGRGDEMSM